MTSVGNGRQDRSSYVPWLAADVVLISFFALLGHLSHYGGLSLPGILTTALPFLVAYLAGVAVVRMWRRPTALLRSAVPVWFITAGGGLVLRVVLGDSAAPSFQIVAVCVLGAFLLFPRCAAAQIRKLRRRRKQQPSGPYSPTRNQGAAT